MIFLNLFFAIDVGRNNEEFIKNNRKLNSFIDFIK